VSQRPARKSESMSALPNPRPRPRHKLSKKEAARAIARLLEEQMDEMGLSEAEKNARTEMLTQRVKKAVARSRAANPSK
jgi:hypothetical protein